MAIINFILTVLFETIGLILILIGFMVGFRWICLFVYDYLHRTADSRDIRFELWKLERQRRKIDRRTQVLNTRLAKIEETY